MKTPITDAIVVSDESLCHEGYVWIDPAVARRLELDRAALMEALEECWDAMNREPKCTYWLAKTKAKEAITAAHANFPEP